jgi:hypothetical protein
MGSGSRSGIGSSDDEVADAWSDFLVELADEKGIDVEAQRFMDGDEDDDDPLILVFVEFKQPSDDAEEDDETDEERAPQKKSRPCWAVERGIGAMTSFTTS